jgi:hypothetical protein
MRLLDGSSDPTNRNRIQGRRDMGHRAMDRDAHTHSDVTRVNPAGPEPRTDRLTVGDLHFCLQGLLPGQPVGKGMEKSAEAVIVRRGKTPRGAPLAATDEGPNRLTQGEQSRKTRSVGATIKDGIRGNARKAHPRPAAPRSNDGKGVTRPVSLAESQDRRRPTPEHEPWRWPTQNREPDRSVAYGGKRLPLKR